MLREGEEMTAWARDPLKSWNDFQFSLDKDFAALAKADELVEKVSDDKLARDVDDLTAIFEGLAEGADFPLPSDDLEVDVAVSSNGWIDGLEDDTINVNELSKAFDALVEGNSDLSAGDVGFDAAAESCVESSDNSDDDEEMDSEDDEEEENQHLASPPSNFVPSRPSWAFSAPLDPRSCIRGPVFTDIDSRIPRVVIPRIDLSYVAGGDSVKSAGVPDAIRPSLSISPKHGKEKAVVAAYQHDPKTCWICKSSKTPEKKRALHRFLEKRSRRNWKRGPRYAGRSHVATSRVRNGGRFICTTRWI